MIETKRRRGRPPKPPNQRRAHTLAIRLNSELYQRLRHAAEANGRSLSEQAEVLLYSAFNAQARAHETLVGMVARGEVLLRPTSSSGNAAEAAAAGLSPTPKPGFGQLAELGASLGALVPAGFNLGKGLGSLAAVLRDTEVAAALRETVKTAVREDREEVAGAVRDRGGSADSSKNSTGSADSTRVA